MNDDHDDDSETGAEMLEAEMTEYLHISFTMFTGISSTLACKEKLTEKTTYENQKQLSVFEAIHFLIFSWG